MFFTISPPDEYFTLIKFKKYVNWEVMSMSNAW